MDNCGVCNGDGSSCAASLSLGAFDSDGSLEILYDFGGDVAGFQADVTGLALTGASDGAAEAAGFTVSTGGSTVIGFSFTGASIPAGSGVLTVLSFSGITADVTELSLGNFGAVTDASSNVYTTTASGSIDHGDPDCMGDYYGDATSASSEGCCEEAGGA